MRDSDQQVVDQAAHAVGLFGHDAEEALARGRIVARRAAQGLDEAADAGDRRLELVARIGDEIGAHALGTAQRRGVVQHDQRQRAVGRRARQAAGMGDDVELGRARQHELDRDLVGPGEIAVGAVASSESIAASSSGWRSAVERSRSGTMVPSSATRGAVGAHDAALAVDRDQRIGQAVDDRLGGGREIVDRGALAAPAGGQRRRRRREFFGGRREGEARHHGLPLARQLADEAREARQRDEIALHQESR